RSLVDAVRVHAGDVRRVPGDPERLAPAAHAPDVADQRHLGDRRRRLAGRGRRARVGSDDRPRDRRRGGVDDQHRVGIPHHRPDAEDVPREGAEVNEHLIQLSYFAAAVLFILSLRWLNSPKTARRGVAAGVAGMAAAIVGTLLAPEIVEYRWITLGLVVGTLAGIPLSRVALTAVPQRTALSHAFGGMAAGLVGTAKYIIWLEHGELTTFRVSAIALEVILGFLTFTGSLMAAGKLQEII